MIPFYNDLSETAEFKVIGNEPVTYEYFVCQLVKEMGSVDSNLVHMALGIAGESGEIVDAIKKAAIYDKPLDYDNVIEELGDLEFYMAGLRQLLGVSRQETLARNIAKLQVRYAAGYSDAAAIARADKTATEATEKEYVPGQAINLLQQSYEQQPDGTFTPAPDQPA